VRVALVDDSSLFRQGLAALLEAVGVQVTAQSATAAQALRDIATEPPEVAVLDVRLPPTFTDEGLVAAAHIRSHHPEVGVLVLSTYAVTGYAVRLLQDGGGGVGYLLKDRVSDVEMLHEALVRIAAGESVIDPDIGIRLLNHGRRTAELSQLSDRERMVLELMAAGRSNAAIGRQLHLSPKTVETHVARVFLKLGVPVTADANRRVLAVLKWLRATDAS
jgi:DNA-binding NarL/FixJ family response regulator